MAGGNRFNFSHNEKEAFQEPELQAQTPVNKRHKQWEIMTSYNMYKLFFFFLNP